MKVMMVLLISFFMLSCSSPASKSVRTNKSKSYSSGSQGGKPTTVRTTGSSKCRSVNQTLSTAGSRKKRKERSKKCS